MNDSLEAKLEQEGVDCCVEEVGEVIQELVRTLQIFERNEITSEGFTISQCYIMFYLRQEQQLTMKELSEKMNLDTSTITRVIGNLVRDGYVKKERSPADGRVVLAKLTPAGEEKAAKLQQKVTDYYRQIIEEIPEGEVMQVVESVNTLLAALQQAKPLCC